MHIRHCPTHRVLLGGNYKTVFLVHISMLALAGPAHSLPLKCSCKAYLLQEPKSYRTLCLLSLVHYFITLEGDPGEKPAQARDCLSLLPAAKTKTKTNQVNKPTDNGVDVQAQALPKQGPLCLPSTKQEEMRGLWTPRQECSPQQERRWRRRRSQPHKQLSLKLSPDLTA